MDYPQVVRIYATTQAADYDCPWQTRTPVNGTGSGVVIGKNRILTGAHVVANATFIQVQTISDTNKAIAHVKSISHDCDLAILEVESPQFLEGIDPAQIGTLPDLRDNVTVVGFPVGGEEISVTEGVVSRLEVQRYEHSQRRALAITVDAAINAGNSGGPVFREGKVVGIAFQTLNHAENIGEVVPAPIIENFLERAESQSLHQLPGLGLITQNLENIQLRNFIGLKPTQSGVMVTNIEFGGSSWGLLQIRDVLLKIDGYEIANNGTIQYLGKYRTSFESILGTHQLGDTLPLVILRDGLEIEVSLTLMPRHDLVRRNQYDILPTFFIYGGLVFQPLSVDFLGTWDTWCEKAPSEFLHFYHSGIRTEETQEVVVLAQVLADQVNAGYEHLDHESITGVNGIRPKNLKHFVQLVEESKGDIELITSRSGIVVLNVEAVHQAHQRILTRYHIPTDRSVDLTAP